MKLEKRVEAVEPALVFRMVYRIWQIEAVEGLPSKPQARGVNSKNYSVGMEKSAVEMKVGRKGSS